jgi:hypothetical protein
LSAEEEELEEGDDPAISAFFNSCQNQLIVEVISKVYETGLSVKSPVSTVILYLLKERG